MTSSTRFPISLGMVLSLAMSLVAPMPALAQEASLAPASPIASEPPNGSPLPSAAAAPEGPEMTSFVAPAWSRLRVDRSPAAREDHTWTVDAEGSAAYLFGGRDGATVFDDLWRFDLATDTWSRLRPAGPRPGARFGHSAVWAAGTGLVVFAGQRGTDFFGDLWAYDPASGRWARLPGRGAAPAPRYGSCAIVDPDGRLVISHGFTFGGRFDDTRAYDFGARRWSGVAPDGRRPGERCLHECFTDVMGRLVLHGGQDDQNAALGDLWSLRAEGAWRRAPDPRASARRLHAVAAAGPDAWVFGGAGRDGSALDDLWRVDRATLGFTRVRPSGGTPPARWAGTLVADVARARLLLFGGMGGSALEDLWQLTDAASGEDPPADAAAPSPEPSEEPGASPSPG